jgi:hypothetical protein
MKNGQTGSARCIGILGCVRLSIEEDGTLIGRVDTSKNPDECRFTRTVLAGEANDLSLTDAERHLRQSLYRTETFADIFDAEQISGHEPKIVVGANALYDEIRPGARDRALRLASG